MRTHTDPLNATATAVTGLSTRYRGAAVGRASAGTLVPDAIVPDTVVSATDPLTTGAERAYQVSGGRPLRGELAVAGAKNAAPKLIIAALLAPEPSVLENVPRIGEVQLTLRICDALGVRWRWLDESTLEIDPSTVTGWRIPADVSPEHRSCMLFIAALLHRTGRAQIAAIGGDAIGARPIDFHLQALRRLGVDIERDGAITRFRGDVLRGADIRLAYPSVGATEQVLVAAAGALGRTVLRNAAIEPEIGNLVGLLRAMGARIERRRGRTWVIDGVASLHGARHRIIGDRLEAASYAAAAIATRGDLFVHGAEPEHLHSFLATLRSVGGVCDVDAAGIRFRGPDRLGPATVETAPHPGFMTDWQPPLVVMLTQADGVSIVHETVYERRLGYVGALGEMGAAVDLRSECLGSAACRFRDRGCIHSAVISGPTPLVAGELEVPDLRAGFAYLLAALVADGDSTLTEVGNIERGYQGVLTKIRTLGGQIEERLLEPAAAQRATA